MTFGIKDAKAAYAAIRTPETFRDYASRLWDADAHTARNAAWVLTQATDDELLWLAPMRERLVALVLQTDNTALRRLTLNLIERMPFTEDNISAALHDFCLSHMLDPKEPSGVQALCMKVAWHQAAFYPELKEEMRIILTQMPIEYYQPGVKCTRRRMLMGKL